MLSLGKLETMRFFNYALAALAMTSSVCGYAQPGKDSTVRKLGMELMDAINTGDKSAQLNFITATVDADGLQKRPATDRLKELVYLYDNTGGFDLASIPSSPTPPGVAVLTLHSKRKNYWLNLRVVGSQQDHRKLSEYFFIHQEDPKGANTEPWPQ